MQKIITSVSIILFTTLLSLGCKKEGPEGPAGPEGPKGNPGPDGELVGSSSSGVLAYGLEEDEDDDVALFRWTPQPYGIVGTYLLETRLDSGSPWDINLRLRNDTAGILSGGTALVYLYGYYSTGGPSQWFSLPHTIKLPTTNLRQFYTNGFWLNTTVNEEYANVATKVFCEQPASTANVTPIYNIDAIRIIVIGAGVTGVISGRFGNVSNEGLSLKEAMEKYGLTEKDFKRGG